MTNVGGRSLKTARAQALGGCLPPLVDQSAQLAVYVTLLRHVGCTAMSHEEGVVVDDDNAWRRDFTGVDYGERIAIAGMALKRIGAGRGPVGRMRALSAAAAIGIGMSTVAVAHCDASRLLANQLGMTIGVIQGLDHIFERWMGKDTRRGSRAKRSPCLRV